MWRYKVLSPHFGTLADSKAVLLVDNYNSKRFKLGADSRKRIETMVATSDGFEIAEADMRLRGPGEIEGTQQSGIAFDLKISNLAKDGQILQYARDIASSIISEDPLLEQPENDILKKQLIALKKNHLNWSSIS